MASRREAAAAEAAGPQLPKLKQGMPLAVKRVAAADQLLLSEWEQGGKLQQVARGLLKAPALCSATKVAWHARHRAYHKLNK